MSERVPDRLVSLINDWRNDRRNGENWKTPYIARWMDVPDEYVDRLFSGEASSPSPRTLRDLALAFNADPEILYIAAGIGNLVTDDDARADDEFKRIVRFISGIQADADAVHLDGKVAQTFTADQKRFVISMFEAWLGRSYLWRRIDTEG